MMLVSVIWDPFDVGVDFPVGHSEIDEVLFQARGGENPVYAEKQGTQFAVVQGIIDARCAGRREGWSVKLCQSSVLIQVWALITDAKATL